jgi:ubiquinone/menaquinone biosynthesis C-methylase UbiE
VPEILPLETMPKLYSGLAKYYDRLESQYRDYDLESSWLARLAKQSDAGTILDLSCGTGRHAMELAKKLHSCEIVAMDSSSQMIQIANSALKSISADNVELSEADFFQVPFKVESFDFICCMYWSLAGLEHDQVLRLFNNVSRILRKGGMFVFDVENAEGIKENLLQTPFVDNFFFDEEEGCTVIRLNVSEKVEPDLVDWRAYYILDWGSLTRLVADRMKLRFYYRSSLESMLKQAGFRVDSIVSSPYGEYEENSPSLYVVAKKPM